MLKTLIWNHFSWRSLYVTANRLSDINPKITISPVPPKVTNQLDHIPVNKLDLTPPPYSKPFTELFQEEAQTEDQQSDVADFVDNLGPPLPIAFNLAAFVNRSESLRNLVRLGVDLSTFDLKPEIAKYVLNLDFEKDVKRHIQFLHDHGVNADDMGKLITKNPFLFKESIENLKIKVNYLKSKRFDDDAIARIITHEPRFLSLDTVFVDSRLGFFQKQFDLTGSEVRYLVTKKPKLISYAFNKLREKLFVFKEDLGFSHHEMKKILLSKPKVWMLGNKSVKERFEVVHNLMGIPHERIVEFPEIFLKRSFLLKQRHLYLVHLNRAQYDPKEPLYVSLYDVATTTDVEFCKNCAKTSIDQYNEFLKTL